MNGVVREKIPKKCKIEYDMIGGYMFLCKLVKYTNLYYTTGFEYNYLH
jgi:hypothetical protein